MVQQSVNFFSASDNNDRQCQLRKLPMCPDVTSSNADDQLLTTSEAARFLRLSAATLERLRVKGEGPLFVKLGEGKRCKVVYLLDDLYSFLLAHRRSNTGQEGGGR